MTSSTFDTQRPVYWTSVTSYFMILAALCCCNGLPHQKTVEMVDPLRSASESSTKPDTTGLLETTAVDLGSLLDAGDRAVVILVAGETRLVAHRAVLAAACPVFAAMFRPDTLNASSSEVDIPDVEGPVLRQLVAFLYSGRAPQQPGMEPQLLAAAETYGVSALRDSIEQQVARQLSVENAAATVVLAQRYGSHSLRQAAVAFVRDHLEVLATKGWAEAVLNHPGDVLQLTHLLAEPPAKTSATIATESTPTPTTPTTATPTAADSTSTSTAATAATAAPITADSMSTSTAVTAITAAPTAADSTSASTATTAVTATHAAEENTPTSPAATPAVPTGCNYTQPPDAAAVSLLWSLSEKERDRRLIQAAKQGAVQEVRALLAAGADVEARDREFQETPLHLAAKNDSTAVVCLLLQASANLDARNKYGMTPLHIAAEYGRTEAAAALLDAGAGVDTRSTNWLTTSLHYAVVHGQTAVMRLLLAASADVDARNKYGETPLHIAVQWEEPDAAAVLLEAGADRGARDERGATPLDWAMWNNYQQLISILQ